MQDPKELMTLVETWREAKAKADDAYEDIREYDEAHVGQLHDLAYDGLSIERTHLTKAWDQNHRYSAEIWEALDIMIRDPEITTAIQAKMLAKENRLEHEAEVEQQQAQLLAQQQLLMKQYNAQLNNLTAGQVHTALNNSIQNGFNAQNSGCFYPANTPLQMSNIHKRTK